VPPGVDHERFTPLDEDERRAARERFGLPPDALVLASVSRLVPRKGFDMVIRAAARLRRTHPQLVVAIAGDGRDRTRLERLVRATGAPVRFLGRVPDDALPAVYGCADLFAMLFRNRWLGLEQEGFGIVFLEAAACGVPQIAGRSGGADEAVVDGTTGLVVDPLDEIAIAGAFARLIDDEHERRAMGEAGLARARDELSYDRLAEVLARALESW
jgi:phosphatidylinositol alpha-1,6-mannosyltransferase